LRAACLAEADWRGPSVTLRTDTVQHIEYRLLHLIKRGIDVAIRMGEVEDGDLVVRPVFSARHVRCATPGFLAARGTPGHPREIEPRHCLASPTIPAAACTLGASAATGKRW
jgi:DNA-binding transcriptional LysR family regulator